MKNKTPPLTDARKSDLFTNHIKLAHKLAGDFSRTYGIPYDELEDDAESFLAEAVCELDTEPRRTQFARTGCNHTSWFYRRLYWTLLTHCTRRRPRETYFATTGVDRDGYDGDKVHNPLHAAAARPSWLSRFAQSLGDDARTVVRTILFAPAELADEIVALSNRPRARLKSQVAVVGYLAGLGWTEERIERAWEEVAAGF